MLFLALSLNLWAQQKVLDIKLTPTDTPKGDLKLADLVESLEYVPLETKANCLVGDVRYLAYRTYQRDVCRFKTCV